ncbi:MAG: transposase, partial [Bacillota bacterium]
SAEDVALLYGARWSIELLFKELKRVYQLDVIHSAKSEVVQALVLVAMLTLEEDPLQAFLFFMMEAPDPNINRKRLPDPWVKMADLPARLQPPGIQELAKDEAAGQYRIIC